MRGIKNIFLKLFGVKPHKAGVSRYGIGAASVVAVVSIIWPANAADEITCPAGTYATDDLQCLTCRSAGYWCPGGDFVFNANTASEQGINDCPVGYGSSFDGSYKNTQCFRSCLASDVTGAASVHGVRYYNGANQCIADSCAAGWTLSSGTDLSYLMDNVTSSGITNSASIGLDGAFTAMGGGTLDTVVAYYDWDLSDISVWGDIINNNSAVKGVARCSFENGNNYNGTYGGNSNDYYAPNDSTLDAEGAYCWCSITGYKTDAASDWEIAVPENWVFVHDYTNSGITACKHGCASQCAHNFRTIPAFRSRILQQTYATAPSCDAPRATITLDRRGMSAVSGWSGYTLLSSLYTIYGDNVYTDSNRTSQISHINSNSTYSVGEVIAPPSFTGTDFVFEGYYSTPSGQAGTLYLNTSGRLTNAGYQAAIGYSANQTWYARAVASCPEGQFFQPATENCEECPEGYYCDGAYVTLETQLPNMEAAGLHQCPSGYTSDSGTADIAGCYQTTLGSTTCAAANPVALPAHGSAVNYATSGNVSCRRYYGDTSHCVVPNPATCEVTGVTCANGYHESSVSLDTDPYDYNDYMEMEIDGTYECGGNDYTECEDESARGGLANGQFDTWWGNGKYRGYARCSTDSGDFGDTAGSVSTNRGGYCWCHYSTFTPSGSNTAQALINADEWYLLNDWDNYYDCAVECGYSCSDGEYGYFQQSIADNLETYTCEANNTTINLDHANATSNGTTAIYATYNTNVYLNSGRTQIMTTSSNGITVPSRSGTCATITYNANGGTVSPTTQNGTWEFLGYYSASSGGTQYIGSNGRITTAGINAAKALTSGSTTWNAQWRCKVANTPTPYRFGYNPAGWYDAATGGNYVVDKNSTFYPTSNRTLYAHWNLLVDKVFLHPDVDIAGNTVALNAGGTSEIYAQYTTGPYLDSGLTTPMTTSTNPITIPTKTGWVFDGYWWFDKTTNAPIQGIDSNGYITATGITGTTDYSAFTGVAEPGNWFARWKNACPAGTFYTGGDEKSGITCDPCVKNSYCPGVDVYLDDIKTIPQGLFECPKQYPNSESGATSINSCFDISYMSCKKDSNPPALPNHATSWVFLNEVLGIGDPVQCRIYSSDPNTCVPDPEYVCDVWGVQCDAGYNQLYTNMQGQISGAFTPITHWTAVSLYNDVSCDSAPCSAGALTAGEWDMDYTDGKSNYLLTGHSECSNLGAEYIPADKTEHLLSASVGPYCYCHLEMYDVNGKIISPLVAPWWNTGTKYSSYEECAANCAQECVDWAEKGIKTAVQEATTPECELSTYTITYVLDGGSHGSTHPSSYNILSSNITISDPTKSGYTFTGWTVTTAPNGWGSGSSASGSKNFKIATGTYGDIKLTANWTKNMTVSAPNKSWTYDTNAHTCSISVSDPSSGATIKYGTSNGNYNLTSAPTVTNVSDSKTVYYQVTASGYTTTTGSFTCNITKANGSTVFKDNGSTVTSGTTAYNGTKSLSVVCSESGTLGTVTSGTTSVATVSKSGNNITLTSVATGSSVITANCPATSNYNASSSTYTWTVSNGTISATVAGNSKTYDGSALTCNGGISNISPSGTTVQYATKSGTSCGTYSGTAPTRTAAGTTTVCYKISKANYTDKTGEFSCTVNKANGSTVFKDNGSTVTSGTTAYNGTKSLSVVCSESGTLGTVTSGTTSVATVSKSGNSITLTSVATGSSVITANCPATSNYNASSSTYTWTVSNGTISATVAGNSKTYDGSALTCNGGISNISPSGTTVQYATKSGTSCGTYSGTAPTRTAAGTTTVCYKISKANYTDKTGEFSCTVNKANGSTVFKDNGSTVTSGTTAYNGTKSLSVVCSESGTLGTVTSGTTSVATVSKSGNNITLTSVATGSSVITANCPATSNYNASSSTYTWTVSNGTISATVAGNSKTYDGSALTCNGGISNISPSGTTVQYATKSGTSCGTYSGTAPTRTAAGTTTVCYKISKANYTDKTGEFSCTVNKANMTPALAGNSKTYDGNALTCNGGTQTGVPSNSTITYSTTNGSRYSSTIPTRTDIGTTTVYYKITNANYNDYTSSFSCKVNAGTINITWANGGHGTAPTSPASCTYGSTITMPTMSAVTGWTFNKWNVNNKTFNAGQTSVACNYTNFGVYSGNVTITGSWTAKNYTVTYNAGTGGSGSIANGSATYNSSFTPATPSSSTITKSGANFKGWAVSGTSDTRAAGTAFTWTYTENKTFTAQWACKAGYGYNSSTGACSACSAGTYKSSEGNTACSPCDNGTYQSGTGKTSCDACPASLPTECSVNGTASTTGCTSIANCRVYVAAPGTFTYIYNDGYETLANQEDCYTYITSAKDGIGDDSVYCPGNLNLSYNDVYTGLGAGALVVGGDERDYGIYLCPEHSMADYDDVSHCKCHPGYSLNGTPSGEVITQENDCYAITTTITFNGNNGTIPSGGTTSAQATYQSALPTIATDKLPTRTGYTFAGYYDTSAATGGKQYYTSTGAKAISNYDKYANTTLYARWTAKNYTVTYNAGTGGSGSIANGSATYNSSFTPATPSSSTITKSGANFKGWAVSGTSDTRAAGTAFTWTYTENKTFTAQWACKAGYGYNSSTGACSACSAGTYKSSEGNTACSPCGDNTYQSGTGKTSCDACPAETGFLITSAMLEQGGIGDASGTNADNMSNRVRVKNTEMLTLGPGTYNVTFANTQNNVVLRGFYVYSSAGNQSSVVLVNGNAVRYSPLTLTSTSYVRLVFQKADTTLAVTPAQVLAQQPRVVRTNSYVTSGTAAANHDNVNDCKITCPAGTYVSASGGGCTPCTNGNYCTGGTVAYGSTLAQSACSALTPAVGKTGGTYSSVVSRNANTTCRYLAPTISTPNYCSGVTANIVSYNGSAWGTGLYTVTSEAGNRIVSNNSANPSCAICPANTYSESANATSCTACSDNDASRPYSVAGTTRPELCYDTGTINCATHNPWDGEHGSANYANQTATMETYEIYSKIANILDTPLACRVTGLSCDSGYHQVDGGVLNDYVSENVQFFSSDVKYRALSGDSGQNSGSNGQGSHAGMANGEWSVTWPDDTTIHGMSKCSAKSGNNHSGAWDGNSADWTATESELTSASGDAKYCWCKMTGYNLTGGSLVSVNDPVWVYRLNVGAVTGCSDYCPINCTLQFGRPELRSALFGTLGAQDQCQANTYTVTLNKNGTDATAGTTSVTATYNAAMPTPITLPTRPGYDFKGYYDTNAVSGGNQYYTATGASARSYTTVGNKTLYARWSNANYTITLNATQNGGTGGTSIYTTYNTNVWNNSGRTKIMSTTSNGVARATKTKYVFNGYFSAATGGTQYIDNNGFITDDGRAAALAATSNTTWYAQFSAAVCLVGAGVSTTSVSGVNSDNRVECTRTCTAGSYGSGIQRGNSGEATVTVECKLCAIGSYAEAGATGCTECPNGQTTSGRGATGPASCTACPNAAHATSWQSQDWSSNKVVDLCEITSCSNGYEITIDNPLNMVDVTSNGSDRYAVCVDKNGEDLYRSGDSAVSYDSYFSDLATNEFKVGFTYGTVYGTAKCSTTGGTVGDLGTPANTVGQYCWCNLFGYTENGSSEQDSMTSGWILRKNNGDGKIDSCNSRCASDCAADLRSKSTFRAALYGSMGNPNICTPIEYTITYNTSKCESVTAPATKTYTIETPTFNLATPTTTGYSFKGWFANSGLTGNSTSQIAKGTTGNKTFYSKCQKDISYTSNGQSVSGGTAMCQYGNTITLPAAPTRENYTFAGWVLQ